MKMIRLTQIIVFTIVLFFIFSARAKEVDLKLIEKVAYNAYILNSGVAKTKLRIKEIIPIYDDKIVVYYILNFDNQGHIVIANDDAITPILGYDLSLNLDLYNIPQGLQYLLNCFKKQISFIKKQKVQANKEIRDKWSYYLSLDENVAIKSYTPNTYLTETIWGQNSGYNKSCP